MHSFIHRVGAFALTGAFFCASAVMAAPEVGERAPELGIDTLLRGPDGAKTTWADLEGKAVMVEFWATWCGPCIAAFPHINSMVEELADRDDIVILAVTDESREKIERFLEKKDLDTWVGLDTDRTSFDAYGIIGIPLTLIVDKKGRIAAMTYPTLVTADHLIRVADGEAIDLPSMEELMGGGPFTGADIVDEHGDEMPKDLNEMRKQELRMTEPGEAEERLGFLAGSWDIQQRMVMGSRGMGPEPVHGSMTWSWSGDGRRLVGNSMTGKDPAIEAIRILGWNSSANEYYLHQFDSTNPEPMVWSGVWDSEASRLVFSRATELQIMGGDEPMLATLEYVLEPVRDDGFEGTVWIVFPKDGQAIPGMPSKQEVMTLTGERSGRH